MRVGTLAVTIWIATVAFPFAAANGQSDNRLRQLADRYWEAYLLRYPTRATELGDYRYTDRLEDLSDRGHRQWTKTINGFLVELRRIPLKGLSPDDRLHHAILKRVLQDTVTREACGAHLASLNPVYGPQIRFPLILASQPFRNLEDYRAYISRLRAFPDQVSRIIKNTRSGVRIGFVLPRVLVEKVPPQIRTHLVGDVTESEFYVKPLAGVKILSDADQRAVVGEITEAIRSDVIPAYLRLLAYVEDEYLPICRSTVGISEIPNGNQIYTALAYLNTTVRTPPEEIHQIGLAEVARIREEMAKVQARIGFEGSFERFITHMRTAPICRAKSAQDLVERHAAILEQTKPLMPRLFGRLPKADCVMKEIESFRAASSPMAYYSLPPEDGSRPGYFYLNTYAPQQRMLFSIEALTYHEAIPGHHLQMALAQETGDLPRFRRYSRFSAFEEGWALYAEALGEEIGGYQDPYQKFGQLNFDLWRACRLVVDTGIHLKGWSREKAIEYMADNLAFTRLDIDTEVDRYIAWPGQALSYKIGELAIRNIRNKAKQALGERFDLRAFHDALLSGGAMPLDILEDRMDEWIRAQQ